MRKKQNGGWKVSDADWFSFSFYDPSCFFYDPSLSESNFISFLFFYSIRVGSSWSYPDWRSELIRSDFCTCLLRGKYPQLLKKIDIGIFCLLFTTSIYDLFSGAEWNILGACWSRYFYVESEFTVASLCSRGDSLCFRKQYHRRQDGGWMLSRPNLADAHISWAACRKKVSSIIFLDQVFYR